MWLLWPLDGREIAVVEIPILYEDNHLLVVTKPPGILSQADRFGAPDLLSLLKADLKQRHRKPGAVFLGLVHRLDRPVGGVMVFARTSKAASRLSEQIRNRAFQKIYLARVNGCPVPADSTLEHYLVKDRQTLRVRVVEPDVPDAKRALLTYHVEATRGGVSRVRIDLHTGRPHQIRVQLAAIGCPLIGDSKYGPAGGAQAEGPIALWANEIRFQHPTTREPLSFQAPPPWT